ncbi:MAG: YceD family protein [Cyanobacteria bacterium P01_A01_bin.17]
MDAIYIPQLEKARQQTELINVNECLTDLDSLMPVKGQLKAVHQGTYLQVSAQVETIVTLTCDRCLQQYNHRLAADVAEMLWFETDTADLEAEITLEGPVETISPHGHFEPDDWLYQQLCLQWPQCQICSSDCKGMDQELMATGYQGHDHRWAALEALKRTLVDSQEP